MERYVRLFGLWAVLGCGGGRPPPTPPPTLDEANAPPEAAIAGIPLPRMPVEVSPEDPALAPGWAATEVALTMSTPTPPGGETWEVEAWADDELARWMQRRAEAVASAQEALEPARTAQPGYSVVASMLLGLAYSRFALDLRGIPVPPVFRDDPERTRAFLDAMQAAAHPLWQRALDAFGSCASTATEAPAHTLAQWRERCDAESRHAAEMLPDVPPRDDGVLEAGRSRPARTPTDENRRARATERR